MVMQEKVIHRQEGKSPVKMTRLYVTYFQARARQNLLTQRSQVPFLSPMKRLMCCLSSFYLFLCVRSVWLWILYDLWYTWFSSHVSNLIGECYSHPCLLFFFCYVYGFQNLADLVILNMTNIDIVIGLTWLSSYYIVHINNTKSLTLKILIKKKFEWEGVYKT